jgi:DNA-binding GntR family transcriptional regulator
MAIAIADAALREVWSSMTVKISPSPTRSRVSPVQAIHSALFNAILSQDLQPGAKLSEEAIGSFFKVSRTIVRAALTRLNAESVIELKQNRGAYVASPSIEEAKDVFEARVCIEREIVRRLVAHVTPEQLDALAEHIEREHELAHKHDRAGALRLSGDFHIQIAQMAGNGVLTQFLRPLITRTSLILALYSNRREQDCSADEHASIIAALRQGDPDRAGEAIVRHLNGVLGRADLGVRPNEVRDLGAILARHV